MDKSIITPNNPNPLTTAPESVILHSTVAATGYHRAGLFSLTLVWIGLIYLTGQFVLQYAHTTQVTGVSNVDQIDREVVGRIEQHILRHNQ